jgi:hypothetical protein
MVVVMAVRSDLQNLAELQWLPFIDAIAKVRKASYEHGNNGHRALRSLEPEWRISYWPALMGLDMYAVLGGGK